MNTNNDLSSTKENKNNEQRLETICQRDIIDKKFGFYKLTDSTSKDAWLINIQPAEIYDEGKKSFLAVTDFYFIEENGERFKISYPFRPYLYVVTTPGNEFGVAAYLSKNSTFEVEIVEKEDLDLKNHLSGLKSKFLKVTFNNTMEMIVFKKEMTPLIKKNKEKLENNNVYFTMLTEHLGGQQTHVEMDISEQIIDIREHDIPYHMRVCIDKKIFVGLWYTVIGRVPSTNLPSIKLNQTKVDPLDPIVCAFDIETTKLPLKFPDSEYDQIMMISYMIDGSGFLIINREIVLEDVEDFEYTPKPEFQGEFQVFNMLNEKETLQCFFDHLLRVKPSIMVTYNGDFFDWPFVEARAKVHDITMQDYIGFFKDNQDEYKHNNCIHMDAFKWVVRDSYLPMGSQNLKATTKAKLHYDPVELDPELMVEMARQQPQVLANYSVSDAVATYYLYMKYVHPFIFALCTIIPLGPDDVLRKGSGTLCEALLMVEAFHKNIIFPNKQLAKDHKMSSDGHLIESETYVGGHVEALESGVFRADIPCRFLLDKDVLLNLKEKVNVTMSNALVNEMKVSLDNVSNFEEICQKIKDTLDHLSKHPNRTENPRIYHLDVGAMYPNIILTNRLQPPAVINEEDCLACVYNTQNAKCKRNMEWMWRAELIPASRGEYEKLIQQLEKETFGRPPKPFHLLSQDERSKIEKKRIQDFCRSAYGKLHLTRTEKRTTTICQRENAFYVDTVLAFRDRRYEYKALLKEAKNIANSIPTDDLAGQKQAKTRVVLYESLQLAHKCILNSFYGYVMRKGSRWFSMEMAGIVCYTGSNIIREARQLVEQIGRPLELDTDGIWCLLPCSFPENFDFILKNEKKITVSYPGAILNELVKEKFTNNQYHTLQADNTYTISSENSIFFEVDGPYLAMILPASKEEGKKIKKRYAVFNFDGSLAELKGFEVKRRGELAMIKHFQTAVFKLFLKGDTLSGIYENVAKEADYWMDILFTKGADLPNEELFELIGENRSMSKKLEEYGERKSTSITTAKRLAEFLGEEMVKNAGLACKFIISKYPQDAPVTERTIPLAIFQADPKLCCYFLRKWTKNTSINVDNIDVKEIIDWNYYIERVGGCIQKIITIPAALQGLPNPVPRVPHPKWLENKRRERIETHAQPRITDMFVKTNNKSIILTNKENSVTEINRKRFLPQSDYDDWSNSNVVIGDENEENSVSIFSSVLNDNGLSTKSQKFIKRFKTDVVDDEAANDAFFNEETLNNSNEAIDDNEEVEILKNSSNCSIENDNCQFWKKPLKGKSFGLKAKKNAGPKSVASMVSKFNLQDNQKPIEKKTWAKDGFDEWIKFLKKKWNYQLALRNKQNLEANNSLGNSLISRSSIKNYWGNFNESILHIIQIIETKIPGQFTVFALGADGMRRFNLTVPRVFYVDDIHERTTENCRIVTKILPRMQLTSNLYEYSVDEANFAARLNEFNAELCSLRINGIYESNVPLLFKAIFELGTLCKLDSVKNSLNVSIEQLHRLEKNDINCKTLNLFRTIFFYEFTHSKRTVFVVFFSANLKAYMFIVNQVRVDLVNLDNLYKTEFQKFINARGDDILDKKYQNFSFQIIQTTSLKDASQRFHNIIKSMKYSINDPVLFCIQSSKNSVALFKDFKYLNEYPQVRIHLNEPNSLMNVLDWANMMAKRSIQHYFNSFIYLEDYWIMSQYSQIPIGNIVEDLSMVALDVLFARKLQEKGYLLWASPSSIPDFGGKDLKDWRIGNDWESASFQKNSGYIFSKEVFEMKNIVVELNIGAVAVTAFLQSSRISEIEGTAESVNYTAGTSAKMTIESAMINRLALTHYDEGLAASGALRILKEVFRDLVKDIYLNKNIFADQLVISMHRWVRNCNTLMYNPAICSAVSTLMRKICLLLVAEINRLGGSVIHCSFTKIVLSTNRSKLNLAKNFVESLINSLAEKPIFASLHFSVLQYSKLFLWIDPTNYALIKCSNNEEDINNTQEEAQVRLHFLMSKCLPEESGCVNVFKSLIAGYLVSLLDKLKDNVSDDEFKEYCNKILEEELTPTLFKLTSKFVEVKHQLKLLEQNCPVYFMDVSNVDVPLEFVKCVCKILSVNPYISDRVDNVRSQLMLILQLDDASPLTIWTPPSINVVLEYVYCKKCNQSADLNLSIGTAKDNDGNVVFVCSICRTKLPTILIEEMLIEKTSKILQSFLLQDYKCSKCNKVAMCYLAKYCECSNVLSNTIEVSEFQLNLKVILEIAKRHKLRNLHEMINQIYFSFN